MKQQIKYIIETAKALEIKPNAKYLLIFPNPPDNKSGNLSQIDKALQNIFDGQVLALFVKDVTDVKIAELVKES